MVAEATRAHNRLTMAQTPAPASPAPRRAKRDQPMTPTAPERVEDSRRQRNELSPLGGVTDGGVPAVVPPAAKVRLTIPDCVVGSSQSTVQQLAEDLKTMHSYFKQAIEHVAVHVHGNSAAIAGIRSDMNEVKLACKESPTLLEFQEVEVALTKQVMQTAVHENTFEAFKTDVAAISAGWKALSARSRRPSRCSTRPTPRGSPTPTS